MCSHICVAHTLSNAGIHVIESAYASTNTNVTQTTHTQALKHAVTARTQTFTHVLNSYALTDTQTAIYPGYIYMLLTHRLQLNLHQPYLPPANRAKLLTLLDCSCHPLGFHLTQSRPSYHFHIHGTERLVNVNSRFTFGKGARRLRHE